MKGKNFFSIIINAKIRLRFFLNGKTEEIRKNRNRKDDTATCSQDKEMQTHILTSYWSCKCELAQLKRRDNYKDSQNHYVGGIHMDEETG